MNKAKGGLELSRQSGLGGTRFLESANNRRLELPAKIIF
jgi:hypothetical protein